MMVFSLISGIHSTYLFLYLSNLITLLFSLVPFLYSNRYRIGLYTALTSATTTVNSRRPFAASRRHNTVSYCYKSMDLTEKDARRHPTTLNRYMATFGVNSARGRMATESKEAQRQWRSQLQQEATISWNGGHHRCSHGANHKRVAHVLCVCSSTGAKETGPIQDTAKAC